MKQVLIILALAIIIRICFLVVAMPEGVEIREGTTSDAPFFDKLATNIIEGNWFNDEQGKPIFTSPAYPLFLAGTYYVFGHNYDWARIIQSLLWVVICVLIYFLGKEIFNKKIGFIAGLVTAIYPGFIIEPIKLLRETLFIFFLVCFALWLIRGTRRNSLSHLALSGIFLGLTVLTRTVILYFPIFILFYLLLVFKDKKRAILSFIVVVIAGAIIVIPWSVRNYVQTKQVYPYIERPITTIVSGGGIESGLSTYNDWKSQVRTKGFFYKFYKIYGFPHNLSYFESAGYKQILNKFVKGQVNIKDLIIILKKGTFWVKASFLMFYYLILIGSLIGLVYLYKKWKRGLFLVFLIGYVSAAPLLYIGVTSPAPRYKFYIMPFIIIFAAYGVYSLFLGKRDCHRLKTDCHG